MVLLLPLFWQGLIGGVIIFYNWNKRLLIMKKAASLIMIFLLSLLSGCTGSYDDTNYISDPFSNTAAESVGNNGSVDDLRDAVASLSVGGYKCEINKGGPVEYNGEPVILPVDVTADKECAADMSLGIMCLINGRVQQLSSENDKDKPMIIKTGIAPGDSLTFDITFTPEVVTEDAEQKQLPITFLTVFNPTFTANEGYPTFGNTHDIGLIPSRVITFNSKPNFSSKKEFNIYTEEKINGNDEGGMPWYSQNGLSVSVLKINETGILDFTACFQEHSNGEYIGYVLKNNELVTINGGQDCVNMTVKETNKYSINIKVEDVKKGDVIQCFIVKKEGEVPTDLIKFSPILVVDGDFVMPAQSTEASSVPSETDFSLPAETGPSVSTDADPSTTAETTPSFPADTNPPSPAVTNPHAPANPDNISQLLPECPAAGCIPFGYIGENPRLLVGISEDYLMVCDSETGKLINSLKIAAEEENGDEVTQMDWNMVQVIRDYICVPKLVIKNNSKAIFQGFSLYDKNLNFVKDAAAIADCLTYDGQSKIKFLYDNYSESKAQTLYISNISNENTRERKLCKIPEQYQLVRSYFVTDEKFMYGLLTDIGGDEDSAYAFALDISTGELIINANRYIYSNSGLILPAKNYTLFATGMYDPKSSDSGTIVYFDKSGRRFREIQAISQNECCHGGITPDGSKIVTCASVFRNIDVPNSESIRVYSTADGSLLASLDGFFDGFPVCTNKGLIVYGEEQGKKIIFSEMGLN